MKPIPISAAKAIAAAYGYDQIVIVARKVDHGEHVTTYGVDPANCEVAARIGTTLKHHLMQWPSALFETGLRILGVGRDVFSDQTIQIACDGAVSDDQLRAVHEFLKPTS